MDNFQGAEEDTQVVDIEEVAVSRTATTRRRPSSFVGLVPNSGIMDLPPGTELFGPDGQHGYIAGHTCDGLVIFDLRVFDHLGERIYTEVQARPSSFVGWRTSGGALL